MRTYNKASLFTGDRANGLSEMLEHVVEVDQIIVERGRRAVLSNVTLAIERGRVTGLLGPSGSGKTTLIRAIAGVQRLRSGTITVLGEAAGNAGLRRRLAYVTQSPSVYPDLTVHRNLVYFARVLGTPLARVGESLSTVGMLDLSDKLVGDLSGGERSRVSLAVGLLGNPEVLVLDEPTVGLDPVLRRSLWDTFHALAETGTSILVSTHVMDEAERCDTLVLLRQGHVIAVDTPSGLLAATRAPTIEQAFITLSEAG